MILISQLFPPNYPGNMVSAYYGLHSTPCYIWLSMNTHTYTYTHTRTLQKLRSHNIRVGTEDSSMAKNLLDEVWISRAQHLVRFYQEDLSYDAETARSTVGYVNCVRLAVKCEECGVWVRLGTDKLINPTNYYYVHVVSFVDVGGERESAYLLLLLSPTTRYTY